MLSGNYYQGPLSDHFDGQRFIGRQPLKERSLLQVLKWRLLGRRPKWPRVVDNGTAPSPPTRVHEGLRVTNIGHATLLIQGAGLNILTDPQFSWRASPFSWIGPRRVQAPGLSIDQLPPIDVVFVSHNHYDHLDLPSLRRLCARDRPLMVTPLGNDVILRSVDSQIAIRALDWEETLELGEGAALRLLPCQHWSARTLFDRNRALWGAALLTLGKQRMLFVADSGFDDALFSDLDVELDLVALPIGAYAPRWFMSQMHMNPEEAWTLFNKVRARRLLPIHYDVFALGDEPFGEALQRLRKAAGDRWDSVLPLKCGQGTDLSFPPSR